MNLIIEAAKFAARCHEGQFRKWSHRPYIEHPMRVAGRLSLVEGVGDKVVAAAWLHDVLEDTGVTREELSNRFPLWIGVLVQELTNPSKGSKLYRQQRKQMDRDHLAKVSPTAKLIKMLDRIDNLRDMKDAPYVFRCQYAWESELLLPCLDFDEPLYDTLRNEMIEEINVTYRS